MIWQQVYDPLHNAILSTILAAVPIVVLLGTLAFLRMAAHWAAILGLISALAIAILVFGMPANMALGSAGLGAMFGLLPIGWIVLNIIFLYQLTKDKGYFKVLQDNIANVTEDRRLQLLLIAFAFGAFFEGAAGFGTPVAVTGAILIGLGFSPLAASGLSLIANTAPVAYGALGTPIITLAKVTGLDEMALSAMVGRQLPFFSVLVPFWLIWAFSGWKGVKGIWPAILVTGRDLRHPAVPDLQLPWPHAGGRGRGADIDGLPDAVPEGLEAQGDLAHHEAARATKPTAARRARPRASSATRPAWWCGPGFPG